MKLNLTALFLIFAGVVKAETPPPPPQPSPSSSKLIRTCYVYSHSSADSQVQCTLEAGTLPEIIGNSENGFIEIKVAECKGYISELCLDRLPETAEAPQPVLEKPRKKIRKPKRSATYDERGLIPAVSLLGFLNSSQAKVPYSATSSSGTGFGVLLEGSLIAEHTLRMGLGVSYQQMLLGREVDSSGSSSSIVDENPNVVSQKATYVGVGVRAGVQWTGFFPQSQSWAFEGWLDLGAEYLHPLSVTQTDLVQGDISIPIKDRLFLLYTGPSLTYRLTPTLAFDLNIHAYFNMAAAEGSSLSGLRLVGGARLSL